MPTCDQRKSEQKAGLSQSFLMYVWTLPVSQATVLGVASILTQVPECCWLLGNQAPPKQEGIGGINSLTSSTIKLHPLKLLQPFLKSLP